MSAISTFAAQENASLAQIQTGILALDAQIQKLQNSPDQISAADQASLDAIVASSARLAAAANAVIPAPASGVPAAPTLTAVTAVSPASGVILTVGPVTSGVTFNIFSGVSAGAEGATPINPTPLDGSVPYNDVTPATGVTTFYTAVAINSVGTSPASAEVSAVAA